jgi:hypothetical protein
LTISSTPQVSVGGVRPGVVLTPVEYKRVVSEPARRLVLTIDGPPKEGKTEFTLTAPEPITIHNLDLGLEGVVEKFAATKEIYAFDYQIPMSAMLPGSEFSGMSDAAQKVWKEYVRNFRDSLSKMRTIVVDTGTEAWQLVRLARLGKLTSIMPVQYTAVNAEFRQLTQLALSQNSCNVIFTHKVKDVYKDDKKTGEIERAGFGEIEYDVQAVLKASRDYAKTGVDQFSIQIATCRANLGASGRRFTGTDCTFTNVATAIYPSTDEKYWK